ncbi:MAG: aspartate aminotransferase family protein, partial [Nakamurella sp.]
MSEPTDQLTELLRRTGRATTAYLASLPSRPVGRPVDRDALRTAFGGSLPADASAPADVIEQLI